MASQFQPIAALVSDDSGTPDAPVGDGTQINSTFFAAIDAILNEIITRSAKTVGGVWTWETFGLHNFSGGGAGNQTVLVKNTSSGTNNTGRIAIEANGVTGLYIDKFSSAWAPSTNFNIADGCRFYLTGANGLMSFVTDSLAGFEFWPAQNKRVAITSANGAIAENGFGWKLRNAATAVIDGIVINATNDINIASDNAGSVGSLTINAGSIINFRTNSALRGTLGSGGLLVGANAGNPLSTSITPGTAPVGSRIQFGTDGTGWQLRFSKNQGGSITDLWKITDAGHLLPVGGSTYNIGDSTDRIGTITTVNLAASASVTAVNTVVTGNMNPGGDSSGNIGAAVTRWANIYGVNIFAGDVHFENGWSFTEHYKLDIETPGIALVDDSGELQLFIGKNRRFYTHRQEDIRTIKYVRRTREERAAL